jgi:hypothetical protein
VWFHLVGKKTFFFEWGWNQVLNQCLHPYTPPATDAACRCTAALVGIQILLHVILVQCVQVV